LAYYEQLKADLELLERYEASGPRRADAEQALVFERAYVESPSTCDAFVTRAAGEAASDRWEAFA
jgi:hypothetical protein